MAVDGLAFLAYGLLQTGSPTPALLRVHRPLMPRPPCWPRVHDVLLLRVQHEPTALGPACLPAPPHLVDAGGRSSAYD